MSRRPDKRKRPPIPGRVTPTLPPSVTPQARAKIRMVKGKYRIMAGNRVIELKEIPTMVRNIKEKRTVG